MKRETVKIKLNYRETDKSSGSVATYYSDKDLLILSDDINVYYFTLNDSSKESFKLKYINSKKISAYTPIYIAAPYGTDYCEVELYDAGTLTHDIYDCIGYGFIKSTVLREDAKDFSNFNLYGLSISNDGKFALFKLTGTTFSPNKCYIPFVNKDNYPNLSNYYYKSTGLRVDFDKLRTELTDASKEQRQKVYDKLMWHVSQIKEYKDYDLYHIYKCGKWKNGNTKSMLNGLLYDFCFIFC